MTTTESESGAVSFSPRGRVHRQGIVPADAVRDALSDGPRKASEMLSLLRAAKLAGVTAELEALNVDIAGEELGR